MDKHIIGMLAEERYSFDRYYCPGCNKHYRTYYTFSIPGHFINTPERWSCPLGCVYSSFYQHTPIATELRGKCNIYKKGKNCFVKYTYVPHLKPNTVQHNIQSTPYGNSIGIRNGPQGTNNNIAGTAHDILLEQEMFHPQYNISIDNSGLVQSTQMTCPKKENITHHLIDTRVPIYSGNNYIDNNYHGYMQSIDWNKRLKQIYPNPFNIWARN